MSPLGQGPVVAQNMLDSSGPVEMHPKENTPLWQYWLGALALVRYVVCMCGGEKHVFRWTSHFGFTLAEGLSFRRAGLELLKEFTGFIEKLLVEMPRALWPKGRCGVRWQSFVGLVPRLHNLWPGLHWVEDVVRSVARDAVNRFAVLFLWVWFGVCIHLVGVLLGLTFRSNHFQAFGPEPCRNVKGITFSIGE
ncbi:hypothetical protein INR49_011770 [Caranx melampygus]|nr:hypothetical protein INR49_011770 [Caranx melampygus]